MGFRLWVLLGLCTGAASAADFLIDAATLAVRLRDPDLVLLHAGTAKDYAAGHLPGARLVTLADISVNGPQNLRLELPEPAALRTSLEKLGIGDRTTVVLYSGNESVPSATRVWFTMDYLGLGVRALLLDGGLPAWKAAGHAVTTEDPPPPKPGRLTIRPDATRLVTGEWILENLGAPQLYLIDARTPEFHSGASAGMMPRAGRIPGAVNVPFSSLLNSDRKLIPAADIKAKLAPPAGAKLVVYCHIGQQATLLYFAARMAGLIPFLYDGSFQEWSSQENWPVEVTPR
jgi:thiosulfate/3-mercaptopyruvate sulfurtransferase